ncbi:MAG: ribonucleotide-diphosphate reductase subunit beta [Oscillospiraceae bacterium]|nr:ribonucleotide-diphosphate reductase subunit beta [Oscillospiraceae bacterium]
MDTYQGDIGMPVVSRALESRWHQRKSVLNFMATMENAIHAKSYSNIFMTYLKPEDISQLFDWGETNPHLQQLLAYIVGYYEALDRLVYQRNYGSRERAPFAFDQALWQAMTASVFLESCLFYSGFYYPLYFYGQGRLMQAGEIINLILRDESIHGLYIGNLAQERYRQFPPQLQTALYNWAVELLDRLYQEEAALAAELYDPVGLSADVQIFLRYNANKALMNLGFDPLYPSEAVKPVVLNGLNTQTKTMDNFSMKGNGYQKIRSEALQDEDFVFHRTRVSP